jgi:hypothetical protein
MTSAPSASREVPVQAPDTLVFALAGLGRVANDCGLFAVRPIGQGPPSPAEQQLRARLEEALGRVPRQLGVLEAFRDYTRCPADHDRALLLVARHLELTLLETLVVRLAVAVEADALIAHAIFELERPTGSSRPSIGLLARAFGPTTSEERAAAAQILAQGAAVRSGFLELVEHSGVLAQRQVRVPLPICLSLAGQSAPWPGTTPLHLRSPIPLGSSMEQAAIALASRLSLGGLPAPALVLRSGDSAELRSAAERVAEACDLRAVRIGGEETFGLAPWLLLNGLLPVFSEWLAPGERKPLPSIPAYVGPIIVLTGPDGEFTSDQRAVLDHALPIPPVSERIALWSAHTADEATARRLASEHRHTAGRIAVLAEKASERRRAALGTSGAAGEARAVSYTDVRDASRSGEGVGLSALAEFVSDEVPDEALVLSSPVRIELESLLERCRLRDSIAESLGPAMQARRRASVRALFVGPSGTGKTLAASWLATRLGLPLFRVDVAAISSKYIGETEKNLSRLLARAEQSEVVLLFDEADSLFAKRTDVRDANDRFANAQTNYLLQRMESYDGITVLTSNSRSRFDAAFSRRLDAIVEFPAPGPEERRALFLSHLGAGHVLGVAELNRAAAGAELSGGQIRNVVLTAAIAARGSEPIAYRHLVLGLAAEYKKLGRQLPEELRQPLTRGE